MHMIVSPTLRPAISRMLPSPSFVTTTPAQAWAGDTRIGLGRGLGLGRPRLLCACPCTAHMLLVRDMPAPRALFLTVRASSPHDLTQETTFDTGRWIDG